MTDDLAAMVPVALALEKLGVEFYVGGSVASSLHGVARTTLDIDLVAALSTDHVDALVRQLEAGYYVDAAQIRSAIANERAFNLIHLDTMYKVDIFVMKRRAFDESARQRVQRLALDPDEDVRFAVASAEDIILNKLEWYRAAGETSERQWGDVIGVIRVQGGGLDRDYLSQWAERLGVSDLLQRAWDAGGP